MKTLKILLHFLLFCFTCAGCLERKMNLSDISSNEKIELKIISKVCRKLEKEKKIFFCEIGNEKKENFYIRSIGFKYFEKLTIDEMRKLLIYIVNQFIENYNSSDDLLSDVKTLYRVKNFEIVVYLREKNGDFIPYPELTMGELYNNRLIYSSMDVIKYKIETLYQETYEEAVEKLKNKSLK